MSNVPKISYPIGSKNVQGGLPVNGQTLIFNSTTNVWEFGSPSYTSIGNYVAAVIEATHTFNFPEVDFDIISHLILTISATTDGGGLNMLMRFNGSAAATYFVDGRDIRGGVETLIDLNAQTSAQLASNAILSGNGVPFTIYVVIMKSVVNDNMHCIATVVSNGAGRGQQMQTSEQETAIASLTSLDILTSVSNWRVGSRMSLFSIRRA